MGGRAGTVASVFIVKPSTAGLHSLLRRAIFAHSQNQQQQINAANRGEGTPLCTAPNSGASVQRSTFDLGSASGAHGAGHSAVRLGTQQQCGARQVAALGARPRESPPHPPPQSWGAAGSVRSLAGRRAGRHRRGIGLGSLGFQRWLRVPGPQVFSPDLPSGERPAMGSVVLCLGADPARALPTQTRTPAPPCARPPHPALAAMVPAGIRVGPIHRERRVAARHVCASTDNFESSGAAAAPLGAGWQMPAVLRSPSPRSRGRGGGAGGCSCCRHPAALRRRQGGEAGDSLRPFPRSPPLRPARRLDRLQVPGSAALPACNRGPRAPTPPPAQMSDARTGYGPT